MIDDRLDCKEYHYEKCAIKSYIVLSRLSLNMKIDIVAIYFVAVESFATVLNILKNFINFSRINT